MQKGKVAEAVAPPSRQTSWLLWLNPQDCHRGLFRWRATTEGMECGFTRTRIHPRSVVSAHDRFFLL